MGHGCQFESGEPLQKSPETTMVLGLFLFLRPGSVPRFPSLSFKLADHHRQQVQQIFGHFGLLFQKSDYFFGLIGIGISSFLFHCLKKVLFHQPCQLLALGVIRK